MTRGKLQLCLRRREFRKSYRELANRAGSPQLNISAQLSLIEEYWFRLLELMRQVTIDRSVVSNDLFLCVEVSSAETNAYLKKHANFLPLRFISGWERYCEALRGVVKDPPENPAPLKSCYSSFSMAKSVFEEQSDKNRF